MKQDAFSAGVEPGGLWNKNDIRILLCYILASVNAPLARQDLTRIIQEKGLANYFEAEDALALWCPGQCAQESDGCYTVTAAGREIAHSLDATLPLSVRDKALEAAFTLLAQAKAQRENRVELQKIKQGYQVTCHISGGDMDLMAITLYVPTGPRRRWSSAPSTRTRGGLQAGAGLSHRRHRPCPGIPAGA